MKNSLEQMCREARACLNVGGRDEATVVIGAILLLAQEVSHLSSLIEDLLKK